MGAGPLQGRAGATTLGGPLSRLVSRIGVVGKNLLYYFVAGTVIALVAERLGASLGVVFLASAIGPAVLLLAVAILRYNRRL